MTEKMYYQCRLKRDTQETIGWIEERGAKAGATVEMPPGSGLMWHVVRVGEFGLPQTVLRENQLLNRKSLPSVDPIA